MTHPVRRSSDAPRLRQPLLGPSGRRPTAGPRGRRSGPEGTVRVDARREAGPRDAPEPHATNHAEHRGTATALLTVATEPPPEITPLDTTLRRAVQPSADCRSESAIVHVPLPTRSHEQVLPDATPDLLEPHTEPPRSQPPTRALNGVTLLPGPLPQPRTLSEPPAGAPDRHLSGFRDAAIAEAADLGEATRRARVARARREARRRRLQRARLVELRRTDRIVRAALDGTAAVPAGGG